MTAPKLSAPMLAMLRNASIDRSLTHGLSGRSAHGGAFRTEVALIQRGYLLRDNTITTAGIEALAAHNEAKK